MPQGPDGAGVGSGVGDGHGVAGETFCDGVALGAIIGVGKAMLGVGNGRRVQAGYLGVGAAASTAAGDGGVGDGTDDNAGAVSATGGVGMEVAGESGSRSQAASASPTMVNAATASMETLRNDLLKA